MKLWEVAVKSSVEPEIRKKIKRLLRPVLSVQIPGKCLFCSVTTTWAVNNKALCPACHIKYGFIKKDVIPGPCEICGLQGEWYTDGEPIHSLCFIHRDAWFRWKNPELDFVDKEKMPVKWCQVWEEGWSRFVTYIKEAQIGKCRNYDKYKNG